MSSVVIAGNTSGSIAIAAPAVAGSNTITLPAETGTLVTSATTSGISGSAISTGTVGVAYGGTGLNSFTSGGAIYATSTSALTTGTLPVASGGTGTNSLTANNVLLGNGTSAVQVVAPGTNGNVLTSNGTTWTSAAAPSSTPTTAQVLTATSGASVSAVGTYAFLGQNTMTTTTLDAGTNYAGSGLVLAGIDMQSGGGYNWSSGAVQAIYGGQGGATQSGTWKCMGSIQRSSSDTSRATLFLRVA